MRWHLRGLLGSAALAFFVAGTPLAADSWPLQAEFPRGEDSCWGAEPGMREAGRRLQAYYLMRSMSADPMSEEVPVPREQRVREDVTEAAPGEIGDLDVNVYAQLRGHAGPGHIRLNCRRERGSQAVTCAGECDAGVMRIQMIGGRMEVTNERLSLNATCGGGGRGRVIAYEPRAAERLVRLARLPMGACLMQREAARPSFVRFGPPLREVVAEKGGVACFTRAYDSEHLARNPNQRVTHMTLRATWRAGDADVAPGLDLTISGRLRDGANSRVQGTCVADGYGFACDRQVPGEAALIQLTRGPNGSAMLRPSNDAEGPAEAQRQMGAFLGLDLGRGDDVFRLDPVSCDAGTR